MTCIAIIICVYTFVLVRDYGSIDFFTLDEQSLSTPFFFAIDFFVITGITVPLTRADVLKHLELKKLVGDMEQADRAPERELVHRYGKLEM